MQLLPYFHIIYNILKLILYSLNGLVANFIISEKCIYFLIILIYALPRAMFKFLARLFTDKRKIVLYISAFFTFIKIAIFPLPFFKIEVILNCNDLVYFKVV